MPCTYVAVLALQMASACTPSAHPRGVPPAPDPSTSPIAPSTSAQPTTPATNEVAFQAGALSSDKEAQVAFERAWREAVVPLLEARRPDVLQVWQPAIAKHQTLESAHRKPCRELAEQIRSTLGPTEGDAIVLGDLGDLDAPGDCWVVTRSIGFMTLMVPFRVTDGALLLVYWPPEG